MAQFIEKTHTCTNCSTEIRYTSTGGWYNARTKLNRTGELFCPPCAGKIGRANSDKKPTGRPKGSKNSYKYSIGPERVANIGWENPEVRLLVVARRNGFQTYEEYAATLSEWKKYKLAVWRVTNQQPLHTLEHYEKRGMNGETGVYTLDHIVSIRKGFNENISPEQIGHISNLQMLPWEENILKGWK